MYRLKYRHEDEMKDSGIEWLGMIPKEWECGRIQQFFNVRTEKVSDKDYEPLSVTKNGVLKQLENVAKTNNGDNRKKVKKNDFVINSRADRKGSCGVSPFDGSVSLICHVLTPKSGIVPEYINHLFRNYYFSEEFFRWGTGIVDDLWSTNIDRMKKITIPIPMEQEKIANFLDIKTAQFDSIISKKEKLIEKLEEAKKSLISEVVTGKVKIVDGQLVERKPEEMKDSGVEWLGMIPKDWEVKKLKYLVKINPPKSEIKRNKIECTFVPMERIHNGVVETNEVKYVNEVYDGYTYFRNDDIVMAKVTPCYENGDIAIAKNLKNGIGFGTTEINVFRTTKIDTKYIFYAMQESHFMRYGASHMTGVAGLKRVPTSYFANYKLAIPNKIEQKQIAIFLNNKIENIRSIKGKTKLQIQKLKSAKQSLISEAVTGKIDLRDWEIVDEGGEKL